MTLVEACALGVLCFFTILAAMEARDLLLKVPFHIYSTIVCSLNHLGSKKGRPPHCRKTHSDMILGFMMFFFAIGDLATVMKYLLIVVLWEENVCLKQISSYKPADQGLCDIK